MRLSFPIFFLFIIFSCSNKQTGKDNKTINEIDSLYIISKDIERKNDVRIRAIDKAIEIVQEKDLKKLHLKYLSAKTTIFASSKDYDSALFHTDRLLEKSREYDNIKYIAKSFYKKGQYLRIKNVNDSAYSNYRESQKLYTSLNDTINIGRTIRGMSNLRKDLGDFYGSQSLAIQALKDLPKTKKTKKLRHDLHTLLGISANNLNDFDGAFKSYNTALYLAKSKNDSANIYNNLGIYAKKRDSFSLAITYFNKGLSLYNNPKKDDLSPIELKLLGHLIYSKGKKGIPKTIDSLIEIRKLKTELKGTFATSIHITELYLDRNDFQQVEKFALEALQIGKEIKSPDAIVESLGLLIESKTNNINQYAIDYKRLTDSIKISKQKLKNTFDRIEFDTLEKEKELIKEKEEKEKEKNRKYWILAFSILIISSLTSIYFFLLSKYRKQKLSLQKNKLELNKYVTQIRKLENDFFVREEKITNEKVKLLDPKDFQDYIETKYDLTRHNFKIFKAIALGFSRQEFSTKENKSENTVKTWRNNLFEKLKKATNSSGRYSDLKAAVLYYQELLNFKEKDQ